MPSRKRHGICCRCRKAATLMCMRCEDFYCSKNCQDLGWKSHRYICFPKPPLIDVDALPNEESAADLVDAHEPSHLAEQLRSMANVFQDLLGRLEKTSNCKCNENNKLSNNILDRSGLKSYLNHNGHNDGDNKNADNELIFMRNCKKNKTEQKPSSCYKVSETAYFDDACSESDDATILTELKVNTHSKQDECSSKRKKMLEAESCSSTLSLTKFSNSDNCLVASSKANNNINDEELVFLTSFRSANRVAVCPKHLQENGTYEKILEQIDKYGKSAPKLTEVPAAESYVIALRGNRYARGKIVAQKDNNRERIRLEFVDYGNLAYRKFSELREILPALANLPIHVNIVQLSKVDLVNYDDRILRFFSTFEKKYYKMKTLLTPNQKLFVELYDLETGDFMNEQIIQEFKKNANDDARTKAKFLTPKDRVSQDDTNKGQSTKQKKANNNNKENLGQHENLSALQNIDAAPVLNPPFKHQTFSKNARNLKAIILDTQLAEYGFFACILQSHFIHLNKIQNYLEKFANTNESYTPIGNEYVVAKYEDNEWYRGRVIGISHDKKSFEISYIDFLNTAYLTSKDIRRYPDDLDIDCFTNLCKLSEMPKKYSTDLKEFLKTNLKLNDFIHIDRVTDITDDVAMIECHDLVDRLNENELL